ncbi:hypothetical protein CXF85_02745 [Colwellia sp. 75C3]|uniref:hypothetical protein n=1 Tax=Colwellia sp. 75C3 TaxID=888425 RepID=UPI000C34520E|nr:hypothetical protein [Colwellia sp. 75C3]PKG85727.1 hypothetical protein CXF85_02745 [Colwellia sp. 75C3]
MLEILVKLSAKLQPLRKLTYLVMALLIGIIVTQLLETPSPFPSKNSYAMLSFMGIIWLLLFNILLSLFHNIPTLDVGSKGIFKRVKIRVQRSCYHLLALIFIGLTLVIVFLTVRMLRV